MENEERMRAMQVEIAILRDEVEELRAARERYEKALDRIIGCDTFWRASYVACATQIEERRARVLALRRRMLIGGSRDAEEAT